MHFVYSQLDYCFKTHELFLFYISLVGLSLLSPDIWFGELTLQS